MAKKGIATKEQLLSSLMEMRTKEITLPESGLVVKIAPTTFSAFHKILASLYEVQGDTDGEGKAEWQLAWLKACLIEPELSLEEIQGLLESRSPVDIGFLTNACSDISNAGMVDEQAARVEAAEVDTAEPAASPLE